MTRGVDVLSLNSHTPTRWNALGRLTRFEIKRTSSRGMSLSAEIETIFAFLRFAWDWYICFGIHLEMHITAAGRLKTSIKFLYDSGTLSRMFKRTYQDIKRVMSAQIRNHGRPASARIRKSPQTCGDVKLKRAFFHRQPTHTDTPTHRQPIRAAH